MAFTAATSQAILEAARQAIIKAEDEINLYMQVNNPGRLAQTDAAILAAITALTAVRA